MKEQVSALMDGQLGDAECDGCLRRLKDDDELRDDWAVYHLIGDALRGTSARGMPAAFAERLSAEPTVLAPRAAPAPSVGASPGLVRAVRGGKRRRRGSGRLGRVADAAAGHRADRPDPDGNAHDRPDRARGTDRPGRHRRWATTSSRTSDSRRARRWPG